MPLLIKLMVLKMIKITSHHLIMNLLIPLVSKTQALMYLEKKLSNLLKMVHQGKHPILSSVVSKILKKCTVVSSEAEIYPDF